MHREGHGEFIPSSMSVLLIFIVARACMHVRGEQMLSQSVRLCQIKREYNMFLLQ